MSEALEPKPITSLTEYTSPGEDDLILLVVGGIAYKAKAGNIRDALALVTTLEKGLMSSTDKALLDDIVTKVSSLFAPAAITIASASTINVPANTLFVILTGTTNITNITGLQNNRPCWFYYPTGAGLSITFSGTTYPITAGDAPIQIIQTAS